MTIAFRVSGFTILLATCMFAHAQDMFGDDFSTEMREKFIADQEKYFQQLDLSTNQKRSYEEITRRYDKEIQNVGWNTVIRKLKKKRLKEINKAKDEEMKALLSTDQYRIYRKRQKEITTKYEE